MKDLKQLMATMAAVDHDLTRITTGANVHSMASIRQRIIGVLYGLEDACQTKAVLDQYLQAGNGQAELGAVLRAAMEDCKITKAEAQHIRQAVVQIIAALNALADTCEANVEKEAA